MPEPSSNSVRVRWPKSKDEVLEVVKKFSQLISKTYNIDQLWLFGSYAKDEYRYGSDVDLCIIVKGNSQVKYEALLEIFQDISEGIEVQFHIYKQTTFDSMKEEGHVFIREITERGLKIL
ncbi:MAG: nucleotidyltransferase domain-containing protein [Candidatus Thorarchaeota archaeon]